MRSTAPTAVAASRSCSRARLVALRRQVRTVPAVHMTIGRIRATQSSRFRSAPRCRSPQHPRRREAPTSRSTRPTASARSDPIPQLGMSPASRAAPCRGPYRPGCRPESPGPLTPAGSCRCRPPECVRLPSAHRGAPPLAAHPNGTTTTAAATATCTDRDAMQPRFPVNDRTRGTALASRPAGTGRGRRHQTHDGRGRGLARPPRASVLLSIRRSAG